VRSSSRRRSARTACAASSALVCRFTTAVASVCSAVAGRGAELLIRAEQGHGLRRAHQQVRVAYRLDASSRAIRRATLVSSRSSRRYHGESPSASLTWRKASSPASRLGRVGEPLQHHGSSVRWIDARRDTPEVSASMWRSAPAGSA